MPQDNMDYTYEAPQLSQRTHSVTEVSSWLTDYLNTNDINQVTKTEAKRAQHIRIKKMIPAYSSDAMQLYNEIARIKNSAAAHPSRANHHDLQAARHNLQILLFGGWVNDDVEITGAMNEFMKACNDEEINFYASKEQHNKIDDKFGKALYMLEQLYDLNKTIMKVANEKLNNPTFSRDQNTRRQKWTDTYSHSQAENQAIKMVQTDVVKHAENKRARNIHSSDPYQPAGANKNTSNIIGNLSVVQKLVKHADKLTTQGRQEKANEIKALIEEIKSEPYNAHDMIQNAINSKIFYEHSNSFMRARQNTMRAGDKTMFPVRPTTTVKLLRKLDNELNSKPEILDVQAEANSRIQKNS